jgi:hypothetical protein
MSRINRREFLFSAASMSALSLASVSSAAQHKPNFRFLLPDGENTFAVGEIVPLRIFTKTAYPRLQVNFKANGQLVGTATNFPYQINWTPAQTGDYTLTAEISAQQSSVSLGTDVKVFNLLYDAIGRRGTRFYNVESSYSSFQSSFPEIIYGVPVNFASTLATAQTIRRIDVVVSATTGINNTTENIPFPSFNFVQARLWNNGLPGFQSSPRNGTLSNTNVGAPNLGSTTVPIAVSSAGIKYYLTGWQNLNIALPPSVPLALSIQFAINSLNGFTEKISFARSNISGEQLLFASGQSGSPPNIFNIDRSAIRIWTD